MTPRHSIISGRNLFPELPPDVVELVLPWPPSINAYWRSFVPKGWRRAAVHVSDEGKQYQHDVFAIVKALRVERLVGFVTLEVTFNPPDNRKHDLDNRLKSLCDAMQKAGVYADDVQIREIHARFGPVVKDGRAAVKVSTM